MIIFEIRNMSEKKRLVGYLFYYEKTRRFFAELLNETDEWDSPFIFSSHVKKGIRSIDSVWSAKFVYQRIIPPDRQNLGSILKENDLKVYDEFKLLQLSEGRCAQDDLYLLRIKEDKILPEIQERLRKKVKDVIPFADFKALIFFNDGKSCYADIKEIRGEDISFANVLRKEAVFKNVSVSPGGNGIEWGEELYIPAESLRACGDDALITYDDILFFIKERTSDTTEAAKLLNCSRQYINQLTEKNRLIPVRKESALNIYMKSSIEVL